MKVSTNLTKIHFIFKNQTFGTFYEVSNTAIFIIWIKFKLGTG